MVTKIITATINAAKADKDPDAEQYASIKCVIRNMDYIKLCDYRSAVVPIRTESNPSPMKRAASNRQPDQSHTRTTVDQAINSELAKARYLMDDLADHVFGHIVSTELARDILHHFVGEGIVQVLKGTEPPSNDDNEVTLDPASEDVQHAIEQAFNDASRHACIRPDTKDDGSEPESSSIDVEENKSHAKQTKSNAKGKGKQKHLKKGYSFKWTTFPAEPINEDELVKFLNKITDRAFDFAGPRLTKKVPGLNNRFAAREDKHHAMPLSYEPDGEDMRPDFLLLPMEAFVDDCKTVDPRYLNFTASRLVGEAKNKDLAAGVEQVQRYARGLKRAQPWVHYVLAMTITKDRAAIIRGEGSGTERLDLMLGDGRGCIEFIRILLGLALAEDADLGQNPDVLLDRSRRNCEVNRGAHKSVPLNAPSTATASHLKKIASIAISSSATDSEAASKEKLISSRTGNASETAPISSRTRSTYKLPLLSSQLRSPSNAVPSASFIRNTSGALKKQATPTSSASLKRDHSELEEGGHQEARVKKRKIAETVVAKEKVIFFPLRVYKHTCLGILFTSGSIRGRGTTVFCVLDLTDPTKMLALKMSWLDLERVADQDVVMKRLKEHDPHPNVIVPLKMFNAQRNNKDHTTLGAIRGFLDEQLTLIDVENRVLNVSISELKRPVAYFWGLHDFVRGLRGALLGHEFLTKIGILHRDISENNIVLGLYPWQERGYLIDFDMAILQAAEEPASTQSQSTTDSSVSQDETKHVKGLRTGTFPYISAGVLFGDKHTHFHDIESFLYVLLLFFFSYAGPLPKPQLEDAHKNGFVRPIGSGRLPHTRSWPQQYADWADGDDLEIARSKSFYVGHSRGPLHLLESAELRDCLENHWPGDLHLPIRSLLRSTFTAFKDSMNDLHPEVSHSQFIDILDEWLVTYSVLEEKYSNCPNFTA